MHILRWKYAIVVGVLLMGAVLLLRDLQGYESLWVDEGWSIAAAQQTTLIDVIEFVAADVHPPLYFQLLHLWEGIAGETVFALRYLSVLIVLLTTATIYRMGRALVNPYAGTLAALLFVLHDLVGVLGREVRQYPLTQLMAVLVMLLYWRYHQRPTRNRTLVLIIGGAALLYTHYWGGFLLLAFGLHALITQRERIRAHMLTFGMMGVLFLPWVPVVVNQVSDEAEGGLGHALPANREGFDILTFQLLGRPETFWLILLALGAVGIYLRRWYEREKPQITRNPGILPALAVIIPVGLSFGINFAFATLSFRALSMIVPAAMLLIAIGVASFRPYERMVLLLITVALALSLTAAQPAIRLPWPELSSYIAHRNDATDAVLIETDFDTYAADYYLRRANPELTRLFTEVERRREFDTLTDFETDLSGRIQPYNGLWIVRYSSDYDILPTLAANGWQQTAHIDWQTEVGVPVETWRYDRLPDDDPLTTFGEVMVLAAGSADAIEDGVAVNLLWQPAQAPQINYTVSVFLLDANGALVTQHDSYPLDGRTPTVTWSADQIYYDGHFLPTESLQNGTYRVGVKVYNFTDDTFSEIETQLPSHCADCEFYILGEVQIGDADGG